MHPALITSLPGDDDFIRLPGLFRRWELDQVIGLGADFHLEDAGQASDGTPLFAIYRRERVKSGRTAHLKPNNQKEQDQWQ
jgi:hypothetical protein